MRMPRWWGCLILGLACGPSTPGGSTGSTGASTSASSGGTTSSGTSSGDPVTTAGGTVITPTGEATGTTSSTGDATTAVGECVVDPAHDLCSEGCDAIEDCCKCNRPTPLPPDVGGCAIPSGIVATLCPWSIDEVRLDGEPLAEGESECGEPPGMWVQYEQNGDRIVKLCGEACATYLSGSFAELVMEVAFCEAA
ncbi:hypothetical protein OV079_30015 [Nannocystis pusilla]|uniref:Uncharacterized protein n=1 Tax=Nannocystis pusilla TaxID=889268 RepID=A0A9X3ET87_9BACT|nr:hypothetical protein [Nannocystis pusilla]MCY1009727.1 hypothetical protein [Nannocystis pusilla]